MRLMSTASVAEQLGVSQGRIRAMIRAGRLPATKLGRDYFVDPKDLKLVKNRKPGRPKKSGKNRG
jgi:excisionase family DNA binding protein